MGPRVDRHDLEHCTGIQTVQLQAEHATDACRAAPAATHAPWRPPHSPTCVCVGRRSFGKKNCVAPSASALYMAVNSTPVGLSSLSSARASASLGLCTGLMRWGSERES